MYLSNSLGWHFLQALSPTKPRCSNVAPATPAPPGAASTDAVESPACCPRVAAEKQSTTATIRKTAPEAHPGNFDPTWPLRLSRPLATYDLLLAPRHLHEPLPYVPKTSIVSDVPLDKPAAPIVECRGALS